MKMHVTLKRAFGVMKKEKAELERRVFEAESKVQSLERERDEANDKAEKVLTRTEDARNAFLALTELEEPIDWEEKLRDFLGKVERQGDRDATVRTTKFRLEPWVAWLTKHGVQPTTQRIKNYLMEERPKLLKRRSYDATAATIVEFTNQYVETWGRVAAVKGVGFEREKPTFATPAPVFNELLTHVKDRMLSYGEKAEELKTTEEQYKLAKDLGKYPHSHHLCQVGGLRKVSSV